MISRCSSALCCFRHKWRVCLVNLSGRPFSCCLLTAFVLNIVTTLVAMIICAGFFFVAVLQCHIVTEFSLIVVAASLIAPPFMSHIASSYSIFYFQNFLASSPCLRCLFDVL